MLLDQEILELFRGWRARASGEFVIESERPPKVTDCQHYRCEEVFAALLGWLRAHGVSASLALWSISCGAQMCQGVAQRSAGDLHQTLERRVRLYDKVDRT